MCVIISPYIVLSEWILFITAIFGEIIILRVVKNTSKKINLLMAPINNII